MRLVVLDDDEAIGTFVATVARNRGWQAEAITDESEFQRLVRASPPAAIVLDLQLHASDGVEQLRFLHAVGYRGRIVLISGFDARVLASAQQIGSALGLAIVAVISKPARAAQVHDVLAMVERAPSAAPLAPAAAPVPPAISAGDVAAAIDAGQMELHLQPIVSLPKRAVTHAEGLVRWRDPILGLVPPEQFIPAAETDDAIIDQLTRWVAQSGATHYRRLVDLGHNVQVRIN
ncbi:MAG TPA: EAL domain-containing protein, partial [Acetobacteraceae bacterium]|nr:EAL domain-containing protein [Acetobacteraceae bacterium]